MILTDKLLADIADGKNGLPARLDDATAKAIAAELIDARAWNRATPPDFQLTNAAGMVDHNFELLEALHNKIREMGAVVTRTTHLHPRTSNSRLYVDGWLYHPVRPAPFQVLKPVETPDGYYLIRIDRQDNIYWCAGQEDPKRSSAWTGNIKAAILFARLSDALAVQGRRMKDMPVRPISSKLCEGHGRVDQKAADAAFANGVVAALPLDFANATGACGNPLGWED